ncbi:ABC transporter permease DevC [Tuwongella immobilis]|uniref:ABC3 transporter permease C-terminal domain-containing protein n=1 Tax=Tuwongella immobilis TaxID=692036 RepID=A0A6C2YHW3_9BACT|nr:ABC transporter permease DevC [Tuwongella immobilis]VIP01120.1 protein : Uncharacterized protein OS=Candidatus Entotheonella sp. TSY1 GN=ETSY1_12470 PE=4 SV=1: MacB_PCD: FtsX [Tuwongella immobilis]VTR97665.1 protein : Uncharacterized protein OS=Candidatus Entotheonella sp. TSY1 GN=ETSY1_12470 PE=4 SV=1: MacB_PCD: FtsX [Tuwongella immobilis]
MAWLQRVPLAWRNLTHNRLRLILASAGVGFAVFLMFVQFGFRNALFDSTVALLRQLDGEVILISKSRKALSLPLNIPRARLAQALSAAGVERATPLYTETNLARWRNLAAGDDLTAVRTIRAIAVESDGAPLLLPEVRQQAARIHTMGVLFDRYSKAVYGRIEPGTEAELAGTDTQIVGTFQLGTDFTADGNLVLSVPEFARRFSVPWNPGSPLATMDLGVVKIAAGEDPQIIADRINQHLPEDTLAMPRETLIQREMQFWQDATPIGFAFGFGMVMGFIVGVVICFQILSSDVADHLPEYATLKAMGYSNFYLTGVVLQQAVLLALMGFVPGLIASWGLYQLLAGMTGLPMELSLGRVSFLLLLTVGMCVISGLLALRKALLVDPAEVF